MSQIRNKPCCKSKNSSICGRFPLPPNRVPFVRRGRGLLQRQMHDAEPAAKEAAEAAPQPTARQASSFAEGEAGLGAPLQFAHLWTSSKIWKRNDPKSGLASSNHITKLARARSRLYDSGFLQTMFHFQKCFKNNTTYYFCIAPDSFKNVSVFRKNVISGFLQNVAWIFVKICHFSLIVSHQFVGIAGNSKEVPEVR